MEFILGNYINTTTQLSLTVSSILASRIYNRNERLQYITDDASTDASTAVMTISFTETTTVSRIAMMSHNLKGFSIYYDRTTANTFALSTTADTSTTDYSNNSDTSKYFICTPVDCTSVTLEMKTTIAANNEKAIGLFVLSDLLLDFERIPSSKSYKPRVDPREISHTYSDGGTRVTRVQEMKSADISYKYLSKTFRDNLKTVYDRTDEFQFVAFPTASGWDGMMFECVWIGDFDFFSYSDDAIGAGYSGTIRLRETPI